jgi:hypothetical protein
MIHDSQVSLWIIYGYLICPEALGTAGAPELLKVALSDGFTSPVFKNTVHLFSISNK